MRGSCRPCSASMACALPSTSTIIAPLTSTSSAAGTARLHCPHGPPRVRERYGFRSSELRRIEAALAGALAGLCRRWEEIHGRCSDECEAATAEGGRVARHDPPRRRRPLRPESGSDRRDAEHRGRRELPRRAMRKELENASADARRNRDYAVRLRPVLAKARLRSLRPCRARRRAGLTALDGRAARRRRRTIAQQGEGRGEPGERQARRPASQGNDRGLDLRPLPTGAGTRRGRRPQAVPAGAPWFQTED